jgi:hypothetical protein
MTDSLEMVARVKAVTYHTKNIGCEALLEPTAESIRSDADFFFGELRICHQAKPPSPI